MENMLTQEDLKAIGQVIDERVPKLVEPLIKAGIDDLELRMNTKFDAIHEDIESVRNEMVTKDYLDRKLTEYVRKPAKTIGRP